MTSARDGFDVPITSAPVAQRQAPPARFALNISGDAPQPGWGREARPFLAPSVDSSLRRGEKDATNAEITSSARHGSLRIFAATLVACAVTIPVTWAVTKNAFDQPPPLCDADTLPIVSCPVALQKPEGVGFPILRPQELAACGHRRSVDSIAIFERMEAHDHAMAATNAKTLGDWIGDGYQVYLNIDLFGPRVDADWAAVTYYYKDLVARVAAGNAIYFGWPSMSEAEEYMDVILSLDTRHIRAVLVLNVLDMRIDSFMQRLVGRIGSVTLVTGRFMEDATHVLRKDAAETLQHFIYAIDLALWYGLEVTVGSHYFLKQLKAHYGSLISTAVVYGWADKVHDADTSTYIVQASASKWYTSSLMHDFLAQQARSNHAAASCGN